MSEATLPVQAGTEAPVKVKNAALSTLTRVGRYMAVRIVLLGMTVVVGSLPDHPDRQHGRKGG